MTRDVVNAFHTQEWTDTINVLENTSSFFKNMNLFDAEFTDQTSIVFDRIENDITLIPSTNRRGGRPSYGKDDKVSLYSLPLSYFLHQDQVTKQDVMSKRKPGTPDLSEAIDSAVAKKIENGRVRLDQVHEYMMLQAIKGVCKTPDGSVLADMFAEFGVTQTVVGFDLDNTASDIDAHCAALKNAVVKNLKTGGIIQGLTVVVGDEFMRKLKAHPKVQAVYLQSQSNVRYQEDLSTYYTWGISDVFQYQGITFLSYTHEFTLPNGTVELGIATDEGHTIPQVSGEGVFKAWYGPSNSLNAMGGAEMFAFEYRDEKGREIEVEFETAPLMICTRPAALVKVTVAA